MQKSSNATSKLCGGSPTNQDSGLSQDSLRALFSIARAELHLQPLLILSSSHPLFNRQHLPIHVPRCECCIMHLPDRVTVEAVSSC